jgi:glutathione S-transferase
MSDAITVWTYDWVPNGPRGHVRDMRLRWALEEAGLGYTIRTVPIREKGPDHVARQPFAQVPFLDDGDIRIFESGACLLHLADKSAVLMPKGAQDRADTLQWFIAALNSVELVTVPWWYINLSKPQDNPLQGWMGQRLDRLEAVMQTRDWLAADRFTVADLLMADVLRVPSVLAALDNRTAIADYVARVCARPAFQKAYDDQMAHFAAADAARAKS